MMESQLIAQAIRDYKIDDISTIAEYKYGTKPTNSYKINLGEQEFLTDDHPGFNGHLTLQLPLDVIFSGKLRMTILFSQTDASIREMKYVNLRDGNTTFRSYVGVENDNTNTRSYEYDLSNLNHWFNYLQIYTSKDANLTQFQMVYFQLEGYLHHFNKRVADEQTDDGGIGTLLKKIEV